METDVGCWVATGEGIIITATHSLWISTLPMPPVNDAVEKETEIDLSSQWKGKWVVTVATGEENHRLLLTTNDIHTTSQYPLCPLQQRCCGEGDGGCGGDEGCPV